MAEKKPNKKLTPRQEEIVQKKKTLDRNIKVYNSIIKTWNPSENFWLLNPTMVTKEEFRKLFEEDKSKSKEKSSNIMWGIAMAVDPCESNIYRHLNYTEKKEIIEKDFINHQLLSEKFYWDDYTDIILAYENLCISQLEREFVRLKRKLSDRVNLIEMTPYSLDTYEDLDKLILNTKKIYDQLNQIMDQIQRAESGQLIEGNVESASEKGLL